ncbi:MAG: flagellar biosynthetic protein FliQ [Microthrixaceae bacterium]|nr:flagellar biosynthetic protein FliQ [Microthrixaceae bacterium]
MTDSAVTHIGIQTMILTTKLAAPVLLTALAVGVLIGLVQSATQLQESTIAFVPKFAAIGIVLIITGNWMLSEAITFTHALFDMIPSLLNG